jgi:alpha-1,6-mannosyltransferase
LFRTRPTPKQYCLLFALGYLVLAIIHWRHSWPAFASGRVFADLGYSLKAHPSLEFAQTLTLGVLFLLYLLALKRWDRLKFSLRDVVLIAIPSCFLAFAALPANSTDIMAYIGLGRIAGVYGANPYLHPYSTFADFFTPYIEWETTMPYGPAILPIFIVAGWVSQLSVVGSVFALKFIWALAHIANCYLLYRILKARGQDPAYGVFLFGLNPLILLELLANGHNDGALIFCGLLSIYLLQQEKYGAALVAAFLCGLIKLPGIFFFAGVAIYLCRRREWRGLGTGILRTTGLSGALIMTLLPTRDALVSLTNISSAALNSLHSVLIFFTDHVGDLMDVPMDYDRVYSGNRAVFSSLFLAFCLWRLWKIRDLGSLVQELLLIFFALLIGYATWFFPWYVAWLIPLAALLNADSAFRIRLQWAVIAFSWTSLALYAFPLNLMSQTSQPYLLETVRILIVHLTPLGILAYGAFRLSIPPQLGNPFSPHMAKENPSGSRSAGSSLSGADI